LNPIIQVKPTANAGILYVQIFKNAPRIGHTLARNVIYIGDLLSFKRPKELIKYVITMPVV
jgi:hypothetical protein